MNTVTMAKNEIEPLLTVLIHQLGAEGRATERAVYQRIQRILRGARHEYELTPTFNDLSTTALVGLSLSEDASVLLARILEKAERLADLINAPPGTMH